MRICDVTDRATEILIEDVRYNTFLSLMEYLYTDDMVVDAIENTNSIMDLFQVASHIVRVTVTVTVLSL